MAKRQLPVKTATVELTGEYEGWHFLARTNPVIGVFGDIASGDFERIIRGLSLIIREWNFVDEAGEPMPEPSLEAMRNLTIDLAIEVANAYVKHLSEVPKN
jgi:hypothetical protein